MVAIGEIYETSWGYDMTHNDFLQIVAVSKTGKTVTCKMIKSKKLTGGGYSGEEIALPNEFVGKEFRMNVREDRLRGQYPYCAHVIDNDSSKRMGSFKLWDGKATYYNTVD
ncbi:hypothetical protein [Sulfuricurvum sp.]|uniref:hypothetical protein n=1 Tax=Sulfuricurvum sp. TaxID=2025608 RepID=UPI003562D77E